MERQKLCIATGKQSPLANCVGFLDGSLIQFEYKPNRPDFADFFDRKHQYSLNIMAVADVDLRIRYLYAGHPGSAHDQRVLDASSLGRTPEVFLSENEYLLADSGYKPTDWMITPFKKPRNQPLPQDEKTFNRILSKQRVAVENAFGFLKNRFQNLKLLTTQISSRQHLERCLYYIKGCVIVHNFLLDEEGQAFWSDEELEDLRRETAEEDEEDVEEMESALDELLEEGERGDRRATLKRKMERSDYRNVYSIA